MYFGALSAALFVLLAPANTVQATNYTDVDILNFALNLEVYLWEPNSCDVAAEYYTRACVNAPARTAHHARVFLSCCTCVIFVAVHYHQAVLSVRCSAWKQSSTRG